MLKNFSQDYTKFEITVKSPFKVADVECWSLLVHTIGHWCVKMFLLWGPIKIGPLKLLLYVPHSHEHGTILDSDLDAHVSSNLCYLICLWLLNRSRAVNNRIFLLL